MTQPPTRRIVTEGTAPALIDAQIATKKGANNGLAGLDSSGKLLESSVPDRLSDSALLATFARLKVWAANPDNLLYGALTRDTNGAVISAPAVWPDGTPGTYTADTVSAAFPGAVDAYHVTYGSPVTMTVTQPAVTRDASGAVTTRPALTVA